MSQFYWIELQAVGRIAIAARPRAGDWLEDEIAAWKTAGLDEVVSLLEPEEVSELGLQREAELCEANGIAFRSFPIRDRGIPASRQSAFEICNGLARSVTAGGSVAVHCRAGIGRSSLMVAGALVGLGIEAEDALMMIERARGLAVPDTDEQRDWILAFGGKHR